ncbi:sieve element occlusion amino-terminus protein [Actinidia rufa]|uniref:Sieve element occlusion amino-terminus protein n=1 Tax=Actinidia rufa TaxID=165716 RepID=A0A7J0ELE7_9ERIC|nr:sieve element occlusion amino-terminus protein [Actinidia rufa]
MESKMVTKLAPGGGSVQKQVKSDRSMFMTSDDSVTMKQIQGTHSPDGFEIDVKPLLLIVEDILSRSTPMHTDAILPGGQGQMESNIDDKTQQVGVISMLEALSYTIDRLACEMAYKCLGGGDGHQTTFSLFNMLSSYSWDAKLVLALAAFALNYGEFWLLAQIYSSNQLAKSMATLKQLPVIMEHSGTLKPRFDTLDNLIKAMLELTRCIVAFKELPSTYVAHDVPALTTAMATVPTAVYWTIRGIIACATQITSLTSMGHECREKRNIEAYEALLHIFEMIHIDNLKVLKAIIYAKDDLQPLFDGGSKRRVNLDVLRRKNILLLISGLYISEDELSILEQIYNESRQNGTRLDNLYEVVWVPIVDHTVQWSDPMQKKFETLKLTMPWYTVHHPSLIDRVVVRFVRERWHFRNNPILVVLDPQGRVVSPNAIHMMWIWGSNAFPFTSLREEALWKGETWRLELLVDGVDLTIMDWIREGKYIFVYGGDDIEWIRRFTTAARSVAQAALIRWMVILWCGSSGPALESMLFSKIQLGKADDNDPMMQEIKKLLSYDKSGGWAVLSKGNHVVVNGHSTTMLPTLIDYDLWKEHVTVKGFDRFEFPSTAGRIPDRSLGMKCPECLRPMDKYTTFVCCHDDETTDPLY